MSAPIRTLVLEDSIDDTLLLVGELERAGFAVSWQRVETEAAYSAALHSDIDVILADYTLPQFDARKALSILQSKALDIPFIIVTGTISEEVAVECMKDGAADYLLKDRLSRLGEAVRISLEQRKLAQEQRRSERDLHIKQWAIASSINAVAITDLEGTITYVNPSFLDLLGYEELEEIVGLSLFAYFGDGERLETIQSELFDGPGFWRGEVTASPPPNQERILLDLSASLVRDTQGEPICQIAIFNDITERKQAEEARLLAEKYRIELQKERELRKLKSAFTSMVTHEFRTPLTTIMTSVDLLQKYPDRMTETQKGRRFTVIRDQLTHLAILLDDVLTIGRFEAGAVSFSPVPIDFYLFCQSIIREFDDVNVNRVLNYSCTNPELCEISGDRHVLRQVVANLISNALKYSQQSEPVTIELTGQEDGVVLDVIDRGIGIPEKDQKHLFSNFYRASNTDTIPGTGLGLSIVKNALDAHDGTIAIVSEEDVGTTVTVWLPRG